MKKGKIDSDFGSIMIIVPHQDDEILLAAGVIYEAVKCKLPICVLMVTNGDCGCMDYSVGRTRLKETVQGLKLLGVDMDSLVFLGYADTGMPSEDSFITHLYNEPDENKIYPSGCSQKTYALEEKCDYHRETYQVPAAYCRADFKQDLKEVIAGMRPENIITTSEYDKHGDHAALYQFVVEILKELEESDGYRADVYTGLVHSNAGDEKWPKPGGAMYDCPEGLEKETPLKWSERISFEVPACMKTGRGSENLKYQALLQYETALEPNAYDFLMAFIKDEEIFWKMKQERIPEKNL